MEVELKMGKSIEEVDKEMVQLELEGDGRLTLMRDLTNDFLTKKSSRTFPTNST